MYNERFYKSRVFDEKLNTTFGFLRENLKTILRSLLIVSIPFCLAMTFMTTSKAVHHDLPDNGFEWLRQLTETGMKSEWLLYVSVALLVLAVTPLIYTIVDLSYVDRRESSITTPSQVFSQFWANLFKCLAMPFCQMALILLFFILFNGKIGRNILWIFLLIYFFIVTVFIQSYRILQKKDYGSSFGHGLSAGHRHFFSTFVYILMTVVICFFFYGCGIFLMMMVDQLQSILIGGDASEHTAVYGVYWVILLLINYVISFGFSISLAILNIAVCYQFGDIEDSDNHIMLKERIANFENLKDV